MNQFIITERCSTLRTLGREALRGRWKQALAAMLVYYCATMLPQTILSITSLGSFSWLYSLLVTGPFMLGYSIFALNYFRRQEARASQIFYGFERFGKSLGTYLLICIFIFFWMLICIPAILAVSFVPVLFPLAILSFVPAMIAYLRYSQAFYILTDHPEVGVLDSIAMSKQLMNGNVWKLFLLYLSFIGWFVLASIPAGILSAYQTQAIISEFPLSAMTSQMIMQMMNEIVVSPTFQISMMISYIPYLWVDAYIMAAKTGFYEMLKGNLRPGVYQTSAEIIENTSE